tara:strand:+ start:294 stop:1508 length:1215 start_codon:yes stop_codon:yes gene_type:complete
MRVDYLKKLGPGLLFAGAAIGVSHLVQSTRAGADYGWGLLWALIIVNLFKYPFFQYGPRFALATKKSLLEGYFKMGKIYLWIYFIINIATMFTIQSAVTIVTASLASKVFGITPDLIIWSLIVTSICFSILLIGKYNLLDRIIKWIILALTLSSITAFLIAFTNNTSSLSFTQILPEGNKLIFLIAFMGWMPAPLDISIWHSLWTIEKNKNSNKLNTKEGIDDFNIGYLTTVVLGICFMGLGALVMFNSNLEFSNKGGAFADQLINLYTSTLGEHFYIFITVAALTTMFSTTLTTLDASPRAMEKTSQLLFPKNKSFNYLFWIIILSIGTSSIFIFLLSEMGKLVEIATVLSFITAPFYAFLNYRLVISNQMPEKFKPNKFMRILSVSGIIFLLSFTIGYLIKI